MQVRKKEYKSALNHFANSNFPVSNILPLPVTRYPFASQFMQKSFNNNNTNCWLIDNLQTFSILLIHWAHPQRKKKHPDPFHVSFKHLNHTKWFAIIYFWCSVLVIHYLAQTKPILSSFHPFNVQLPIDEMIMNSAWIVNANFFFAWKRCCHSVFCVSLRKKFYTRHKNTEWHSRKFISRKKPHLLWHIFPLFFFFISFAEFVNQVDLQTERDFKYFVPFCFAARLILLLVWLIALSTGSYASQWIFINFNSFSIE